MRFFPVMQINQEVKFLSNRKWSGSLVGVSKQEQDVQEGNGAQRVSAWTRRRMMDSSVNSFLTGDRRLLLLSFISAAWNWWKMKNEKQTFQESCGVWDYSCRGEKRPRKSAEDLWWKSVCGATESMKKVPEEKIEIFLQKSLKWIKTNRNFVC